MRFFCVGRSCIRDEANVSAEKPKEKEGTRFSGEDENKEWEENSEASQAKETSEAHGLARTSKAG